VSLRSQGPRFLLRLALYDRFICPLQRLEWLEPLFGRGLPDVLEFMNSWVVQSVSSTAWNVEWHVGVGAERLLVE
jgi:hypothetical protein